MLTIDDIKYVSFRKSNMRGYRPEDVDVFIDDVQQTVEKLIQEKDELEKKLSILANQVKKYRDDEDYLKETLLNAKRLSDASLKETKQKCDEMLAKAYKEQLILYAKRMGATYKVMDRTVKIKFSKLSVADNIRYHLKKMLQ